MALNALTQAVRISNSCISNKVRSQAFLQLGVLHIDAFADLDDGIEAFRVALCLDPSAQNPQIRRNPDIGTAFRLAQAANSELGCPTP